MARMSSGSRVILCMGRRRNDCMFRFWQILFDSRRFRYSRNITFSLDKKERGNKPEFANLGE